MEDQNIPSQEQSSIELLGPFKPIIPMIYDYFTWKKQFYPAVIFAEVTLCFLSIWAFDVSVLTTVSLFAAAVVLLDYFLPIVCSAGFIDTTKWTDEDSRKYEAVCSILDTYSDAFRQRYQHWSQLRASKSKIYYVSVLVGLLLLAWLGNTFNSLFLAYLLTLGLSLLPGLVHNGILSIAIQKSTIFVKNTFFKKNQ